MSRGCGILLALAIVLVAVLIGSGVWYLAPTAGSTTTFGQIPWQEVLLFLSALLLWYGGVALIYALGGREKIIYA